MKTKKILKLIKEFKNKNGSCYCYMSCGNYYNSVFIEDLLKEKSSVILHNGSNFVDTKKVYEIISFKEFKNRILFLSKYEDINTKTRVKPTKNIVYEVYIKDIEEVYFD